MDKSGAREVTITKIPIKKENLHDDIKDFAETTMNELLGWYGYDSRRDELSITRNGRSHSESNSSGVESPKSTDGCGWCGKAVEENNSLSSASAVYCSEMCFSQSRRASFKKNKTCDWCKHVRHTVAYVDFHDGASQLQFCSDKCLNQYKMHIFCRETRAHLELHPHLHVEESSSANLITPDLWLKNCKSPNNNRSPSPISQLSITSVSPRQQEKQPQASPLPLISVAHPSKLIETSESRRNRLKALKKTRKRLPATITCNSFNKPGTNDLPQDLRIRHSPVDFEKKLDDIKSIEAANKNNPEKTMIPSPSPANERVPTPPPAIPASIPPELPPLRKTFEGLLPPPTVIVPYPIILPLPIPIPIPIPIPGLLKKEMKEVGLQTEPSEDDSSQVEIDVVTVDEKEEEPRISSRSLRKRKRVEPKGKANVKGKRN